MKFRFLAPASAELDDAVAFYEAQQQGLGRRFAAAVEGSLSRIAGSQKAINESVNIRGVAWSPGFPTGSSTNRGCRMFWWWQWRTCIAVLITGSRAKRDF